MATLIYIHGFLSSPLSAKAQLVKHWLLENQPHIHYLCPALSPYPDECAHTLETMVKQAEPPLYLMGSSMGGFWATWLVERYGVKAVLINPAVDVFRLMPAYIGHELSNYHTPDRYRLTGTHLEQLSRYDIPHISKHSQYWLLAQTGDETLDYRLAVAKYHGCKQTLEAGGDHAFQGFERFLSPAIEFLSEDRR